MGGFPFSGKETTVDQHHHLFVGKEKKASGGREESCNGGYNIGVSGKRRKRQERRAAGGHIRRENPSILDGLNELQPPSTAAELQPPWPLLPDY